MRRRLRHERPVSEESRKNPRAGGAFIAFGVVLGAVIGSLAGEPSLGTLIGALIGSLLALWLWLADRRRG